MLTKLGTEPRLKKKKLTQKCCTSKVHSQVFEKIGFTNWKKKEIPLNLGDAIFRTIFNDIEAPQKSMSNSTVFFAWEHPSYLRSHFISICRAVWGPREKSAQDTRIQSEEGVVQSMFKTDTIGSGHLQPD